MAKQVWNKTNFPGVRYREHPTRKHGVQADKYFTLTYKFEGKTKTEALGWSSQGMTAKRALTFLVELKVNQRTGQGPRTLAEKRKEREELEIKNKEELIHLERNKVTFADFWESNYWPAQESKTKGSKEAELALWRLWITPVFKGITFTAMAPIHIEKIKQRMLKAGKSPATIKYAFSVVSQVWNLARRDGFINEDCPTKKVVLPKKDNQRQRFLSPEEAKTLLTALEGRSLIAYQMSVISLYAGLRFGEVASLEWQDINFDDDTIFIRDPKSGRNRHAYILHEMRKVLQGHNQGEAQGLVFKSRTGGKITRVSKVFGRVANALFNKQIADSRQRVCFHTLRHTFASWLVQKGTDLYSVKELMGHADFKMTTRYSHLAPEGLKAMAQGLQGILETKKSNVTLLSKSNEQL